MPWSLNYDGGKHCELRLLLTVASVRVHIVVVGHAIRRTRKGGIRKKSGVSVYSRRRWCMGYGESAGGSG